MLPRGNNLFSLLVLENCNELKKTIVAVEKNGCGPSNNRTRTFFYSSSSLQINALEKVIDFSIQNSTQLSGLSDSGRPFSSVYIRPPAVAADRVLPAQLAVARVHLCSYTSFFNFQFPVYFVSNFF